MMFVYKLLLVKSITDILLTWHSTTTQVNEWLLFYSIMVRSSRMPGDDDNVRFVFDQHAEMDVLRCSSLKQYSTCIYVGPLECIMLILGFVLSLWWYVLSEEAAYTNFSLWFEPTEAWIHNLPHSRRACPQLHHRRDKH